MENEITAEVQRPGAKYRLTVEPIAFLYLTANILQSIVIQNLYLDKVCLVNLKLNASQCSPQDVSTTSKDIDNVQEYVSQLNICASFLENIPAIICVLFLGPWSNQNGRKLLLILPVIGHMVSVTLYITNYLMKSWPAEYILFASAPLGFFGGAATMFMACNSYISDITTTESRTSRISLLYSGITISFPIGMFASIYLYKYGGYLGIWGTSLGLSLIVLVYTVFFITDSRGDKRNVGMRGQQRSESAETIADESSYSIFVNIWDCMVTTFKARPGYQRASLILLLAGLSIYVFSLVPTSITYLYVRKKFSWEEPEYAAYSAAVSSIAGLGTLFLLPILSSYFKISDGPLGLVACLSRMSASMFYAFATSPLMMYLGSSGIILAAAITVVIRSMISKHVAADELGQVFSVLASLESVVPLMSSSTFNLVYEATIESFPGCVYLVESGAFLVIFLLLMTVMILKYKDRNSPTTYQTVEATPIEVL